FIDHRFGLEVFRVTVRSAAKRQKAITEQETLQPVCVRLPAWAGCKYVQYAPERRSDRLDAPKSGTNAKSQRTIYA
uniref:hypothetical protein n=1 Tax=Stutzerimonas stutzeri TaxID=316 RepID=UPI00066B8AC4